MPAEERQILMNMESANGTSKIEGMLRSVLERLAALEQERRENPQVRPASALLPSEVVAAEAAKYGLSHAFATQLINRVLPIIADATRNHGGNMVASPGAVQRRAGAG